MDQFVRTHSLLTVMCDAVDDLHRYFEIGCPEASGLKVLFYLTCICYSEMSIKYLMNHVDAL